MGSTMALAAANREEKGISCCHKSFCSCSIFQVVIVLRLRPI